MGLAVIEILARDDYRNLAGRELNLDDKRCLIVDRAHIGARAAPSVMRYASTTTLSGLVRRSADRSSLTMFLIFACDGLS